MEKYSHPTIEKLMKINENKFCFDCQSSCPKWASVNNGIFLCLKCAGVHRGFGVNISFVRSLTMDNWDEVQIMYLVNGGNARLTKIFEEYNIYENIDFSIKYFLNAVEYHRKMLRYEIKGGDLPQKPNGSLGIMRMETNKNLFENFNQHNNINYQSDFGNVENNNEDEKPKKGGFFNKIGNFFEKTKNKIEVKIKDMKISEKAKVIADKTKVIANQTKNFVTEKSQDIINSNVVKKVVNTTKDIFNINDKKKEEANVDNLNVPGNENFEPFREDNNQEMINNQHMAKNLDVHGNENVFEDINRDLNSDNVFRSENSNKGKAEIESFFNDDYKNNKKTDEQNHLEYPKFN